ncbi:MAG TPA: adenosylcobinamide-phosphate synthase CbiB [Stellaceae bacterium]|jgi:adenosylcobinamide-phosphate synthase|nr:adenosylcobinamide-phosphate synthase CbiB [Stellaceae bacterium]
MLLASASDPFVILLAALAIDLAVGDMTLVFRYLPHPVVIVGRAVAFFDRRLNRDSRSDAARQTRGIVAVLLLVGAAAAIGWLVNEYLGIVHYAWAFEALIVAVLLAQRSLFEHVAAVGTALQAEGLASARQAVAKIVGRDPESLDEYGVARAAVESLFENFSDGVIAPAFWYLVLGLPGLFAYKTASTLDSMIGHRSPKYLYFGWAAARLDDALNWIPARLTAALICLAALALPGARSGDAARAALADAKKHRSPNAGWPEAAAAGALGLALGGPRRYLGTVMNEPWLGEGRARLTVADIGAALKLYLAAAIVLAALLLTGAALRHYL